MDTFRQPCGPQSSERPGALLERCSFEPGRHGLLEDGLAVLSGSALAGLGIMFFDEAHLTVGGTAGLALLVHFASGYDFWKVFVVIGLPFFWLATKRIGVGFAVRTALSISLTSVFTVLFGLGLHVTWINAGVAALLGGLLIGMGLLVLFRHRTGLGGLNILAFYLQETRGIQAGLFQIVTDAMIFLATAFVLSPSHLALSMLGSVVTNSVLVINHRAGRYVGVTSPSGAMRSSDRPRPHSTIGVHA